MPRRIEPQDYQTVGVDDDLPARATTKSAATDLTAAMNLYVACCHGYASGLAG
jgi:hypothetical protein